MARKSKARLEYERMRANLLAQRRRAEKAGSSLYFDLPETPRQKGQKGLAREYQKAITQLKRLKQQFTTALKAERKEKRRIAKEIDVAEQIIDNVINDLDSMGGSAKGAKYISDKLKELKQKTTAIKLADALNTLNENGKVITRKEHYHIEAAIDYILSLSRVLLAKDYMSEEEYENVLDIAEDEQQYPDELFEDLPLPVTL